MNLLSIALKAYIAGLLALVLPCALSVVLLFPLSILFMRALSAALFVGAVPIAVILFLYSIITIRDRHAPMGWDLLMGGALFGGVVGLVLGISNSASGSFSTLILLGVVSAYIGGVAFSIMGIMLKEKK